MPRTILTEICPEQAGIDVSLFAAYPLHNCEDCGRVAFEAQEAALTAGRVLQYRRGDRALPEPYVTSFALNEDVHLIPRWASRPRLPVNALWN